MQQQYFAPLASTIGHNGGPPLAAPAISRRKALLAGVSLLALAGCSTAATTASTSTTATTTPTPAQDLTTIAQGLAGIVPSIASIAGVPAATVATITAAASDLASVASQVAATATTASQTLVQKAESYIGSFVSALSGLTLPAAISDVVSAAQVLLPIVETGIGIVTALAPPPGVAMSAMQARLLLNAAATLPH